jgi:acyl carrier protein
VQTQDVFDRINEFRRIRPEAGSDDTKLLEAALFVEDVFDIQLSDDEICEENLGSYAAISQFITRKLEAI